MTRPCPSPGSKLSPPPCPWCQDRTAGGDGWGITQRNPSPCVAAVSLDDEPELLSFLVLSSVLFN